MSKLLSVLSASLVFVSGCSGGGDNKASGTPSPLASVASSIDFPLQSGSRVIVAKTFTQVLNSTGNSFGGVLASGNGTYKGNQVVASSPATFDELRTWLHGLGKNVPPGYTAVQNAKLDSAHSSVQRFGLDFAMFQHADTGKPPVSLIVLVMDPTRVTKSFGPALALISRYKSLPELMRKPIDDQVKGQTGFSVTDLTQPESPFGMALGALGDFSHSNQRAILMVNAQKQ